MSPPKRSRPAPGGGSEPRDVLLDRARQALGYGPRRRLRAGDQVIDNIGNEQWQAASVIVQLVDERFLDAGVGHATLEVLGDFHFRERIEHHLFAHSMESKLLAQLLERV